MVRKRFFRFNGFVRLSASVLSAAFTLLSASFLYAAPPSEVDTKEATEEASGGTLTVITVPERAEVWINNNYAGLTPIRDKRIEEGMYTLRLVDPLGQNSASETIIISNGERLLVERNLGGNHGKLRVDTDPQGADVAIIADLGKTPLVNDYLTPGQYRLEVRHPNAKYLPVTEEVSFVSGQPVTISHKLAKPPVFTTKRLVQLGLGTGAILGCTWAIIEQYTTTHKRGVWAASDYTDDDAKKKSQNAALRRTIAAVTTGTLSAALQVTIFIW